MEELINLSTEAPQADVLTCLVDPEDSRHIMSAMPTGCGKSWPQLVASALSPTGQKHWLG